MRDLQGIFAVKFALLLSTTSIGGGSVEPMVAMTTGYSTKGVRRGNWQKTFRSCRVSRLEAVLRRFRMTQSRIAIPGNKMPSIV
jgi:hypothetical protein